MKKKIVAILLCSTLSLSLMSCGSSGVSQEEYEKIQKENAELKKEVKTLSNDYAILNKEYSDTCDQIQKETKENRKLKKQIENYEKNLKAPTAPTPELTAEPTAQDESLGLGEAWTVEGQWELVINGVFSTDERNEYSDKNPGQVVILDYTYTNLGYTDDIQDLYISQGSMQIIDEAGEIADSYPGNTINSPQPVPVGAICANAQECVGLNNPSSEIKIICSKYDSGRNKQTATFVLPVQ